MKIYQRSQKNLNRRSYEDWKKILFEDILKMSKRYWEELLNAMKIFSRKLIQIFWIFLEEKISIQNLHKTFLLKIFRRKSARIFWRMRSQEDVHWKSSWYLILRRISKKIWFLGSSLESFDHLSSASEFYTRPLSNWQRTVHRFDHLASPVPFYLKTAKPREDPFKAEIFPPILL